jgi:membrane-bound lytic murein transglycosylase D
MVCSLILMASSYPGAGQSSVLGQVESASLRLGSLSSSAFTVPQRLRARVDFWKDIFTKYGRYYTLIHHRDFPQITFDVVDMSLEGTLLGDIRFENMKKERVNRAVQAVRSAIKKLSEGGEAGTRLEKNIKEKMEATLGAGTLKYSLVLKDDLIRTQTGIREKFRDSVKHSGKYLARMEAIFKSYGLPPELTRLPFIESSFDYTAYSSVGAAGIWQFMRRTALNYMTVNRVVDQRRDPIIATHAAARYLREAYEALDNWPQAVTSYNHGVGGVRRKMNVSGLSSIADMIEHPTRNTFGFASSNFYPEFLAAVEVYREYKKYFPGLVVDSEEKYVERRLPSAMTIQSVARVYGYSVASLKEINYSFTSAVWSGKLPIPKGYVVKFSVGVGSKSVPDIDPSEVSSLVNEPISVTKPEKIEFSAVKDNDIIHVVRKGETLSSMASRYRVTTKALMAANRIGSARIFVGQRIRIPAKGVTGGSKPSSVTRGVIAEARIAPVPTFRTYSVRSGDTVGTIAGRFGISVAQLKAINHLRSNRLVVGQALKISVKSQVSAGKGTASQYHNVKRGDTLWSIAKRYGISQQQLFRLNGSTIKSLRAGQKLRLH